MAAELNWGEWLARGRQQLMAAGVEEANVKLRWVAAHVLGCKLLDVFRFAAQMPSEAQARAREAALARLVTGEPVQYVIGETDFMGLRFRCDARALIPRPETELLAGEAEEFLAGVPHAPVVVDVGTGTGCVACALAKRVPRARVLATDISADALDLARENARELGVSVEFRQADLLEGFAPGSVDLVVANLPYVGEEEWAGLARNVRDFEPRLALVSGCDGLTAISRLVSMAADVIVPSGGLMLEIGENQADAVKDLLCQTTRLKFQKLVFDYAGQARVMRAMRPA